MAIILYYVVFAFGYLVMGFWAESKCIRPVSPIYGNYKEIRDYYIPNDTIIFSCESGKHLYGDEKRTCLDNGNWNGTNPYCATTSVKQFSNAKGVTIANIADKNYSTCMMYKPSTNLTFHLNGNISKEFILRLVWKAEMTRCPESEKFINGNINCQEEPQSCTPNSYPFNVYRCSSKTRDINFNIPAVGRSRELCEVEVFTKKNDKCQKFSITNGHVQYVPSLDNLGYGSAAVINCSEGYRISGEPKITKVTGHCSDGGQWIKTNVTCEKIQCKQLDNVSNGEITYNKEIHPELAKLRCNKGYRPTANVEATCQLDGSWSLHNFSCKLINCGHVGSVENGNVTYTNTTLNGVTTLQCNKGYSIMHESNSTCQKNESWSFHNFKCKEIRCDSLPIPKNGMMWLHEKTNQNYFTVGTNVTLQCEPGYTKTHGKLYIECMASGKWSSTNATCKNTSILNKRIVIIAASLGAVSSAFVFTCIFVCIFLLNRRLNRRSPQEARLSLNQVVERKLSSEKHEYSVAIYEEIQEVCKKKPTSPLPKIPSTVLEFDYSFPVDQRRSSYVYSRSDHKYMDPDDALNTECSPLKTRNKVKRRNSSADSTYWREDDGTLKNSCATPASKMHKASSNTSLPDLTTTKYSIFENDLYSSD